jgi:hypothetical protein
LLLLALASAASACGGSDQQPPPADAGAEDSAEDSTVRDAPPDRRTVCHDLCEAVHALGCPDTYGVCVTSCALAEQTPRTECVDVFRRFAVCTVTVDPSCPGGPAASTCDDERAAYCACVGCDVDAG